MRRLFISLIVFWASVLGCCFLNAERISGAETLKITQDHFEFREEPRVAEETLLGTLRAGTPVEWTGETSGNWFEVRAPNGQLGWVHESGLSAPKSRPKPTPQPRSGSTPKPESETPRSAPRPNTDKLQKQVGELEKANTQYQALLEEKNGRISELSEELKDLEQKLIETAQSFDDAKQVHEREKLRVDELNESLNQKDEELLAGKVELTKLQKQLTDEQAEGRPLQYLSYGLNLILVILLGVAGLFYVRQKRHAKSVVETAPDEQKNYLISKPYVSSERPKAGTPLVIEPERIKPKRPGVSEVGEPAMVMTAGPGQETVFVEEEPFESEEVIIELSDVLPAQDGQIGETGESVEEIQDVEIIPEDLEEVEEIEEPGELEEVEEIEEIDELEVVEEVEEVAEVEGIEEIEGPGELEEVEEIEEIDELEVVEEVEESVEVEEIGEIEEFGELEEFGEVEEGEGTAQPFTEELEDILEKEEEEGEDFDYDFEEIYTESLMESPSEDASGFVEEEETEEEVPTVEIDGEKFEMLVEQNTQIIEPEEDRDDQLEDNTSYKQIAEEAEGLEEIETISAIEELEEVVEEEFEDIGELEDLEEIVEEVEIEDIGEIEEVEEIIEVIEIGEDVESDEREFEAMANQSIQSGGFEELEQPSGPTLLEPSPILIEPEYEPAEPSFAKAQESVSPLPESKEPKYDIELVNVGKNRKQILHILSKIEGLSKSPQELVAAVPSIIVRGARERDAKNFQVVMQKLGSDVRLIRK